VSAPAVDGAILAVSAPQLRNMTVLYERTDGFVYRHVAGEHLLVALRRDRTAPMFMLTPTAGFLWEQLARPSSVETLAESLAAEYEVSREVATADVAAWLEQLQSLGAVAIHGGSR